VFDNVVIIGPALEVGTAPASKKNVPGRITAFDARTGKLVWRFNTIPQQGEKGNETWEGDSWQYTGNAGAWAPLTLDEKRGYVYLPIEAATGDYYGGHRPGDDLYRRRSCVPRREQGRWCGTQIVHHDIWDLQRGCAVLRTAHYGRRVSRRAADEAGLRTCSSRDR
jgi:quinoprotein glucose dehydrogenase